MKNFTNHLKTLANFTEEQINEVIHIAKVKDYPKNHFLLREGQQSDFFYFVEEGLVKSFSYDNDGKEHVIQFSPENWYISDRYSTVCKQPAKLNIQTIEDSTVVIMSLELQEYLTQLNPEYGKAIIYLLHNHVRYLQDRVNLLLSASAKTRYQEFVKLYPNLLQRVPQRTIASYLGITPESLSRVRKEISIHG
ncbi:MULTISPECIES: Crp/Fnr family transcriptional regulator [Weeksella]|uniref:Crp/Fnr family transcriptional regulator n=1 Tax=Weeksella TaxID=1013 RepID=UPI0008A64DC0|nr:MULTISPECIES: Crp/Fnr family transcriptional regulator [Weeksella]MDK7375530.1 Crp/Fnr family transcriptional regulator [Weeksella virosa]OFM84315.1 Crp/Fnr family transcriptional regulator [Weeksella sp. HMSC059D05]SUP54747.1 Fumarate and nitrate reduction regulatory protein [Weeksella virosa]